MIDARLFTSKGDSLAGKNSLITSQTRVLLGNMTIISERGGGEKVQAAHLSVMYSMLCSARRMTKTTDHTPAKVG